MASNKLTPDDPRVEHHETTVRGKKYHYLLAKPAGGHKATALLIHGFPDLSLAWRYQVPALLEKGLQVVVPDMLGYGRTDAPDAVEEYRMRSMADDVAALLEKDFPEERKVVLGGHDWGGLFVWRFVEWYPSKVSCVFSVCTPYFQPIPVLVSLPQLVESLPNFRYQLQFAGDEVSRRCAEGGRPVIRQFLNCLYGGLDDEGKPGVSVAEGVDFARISKLNRSALVSDEELDFYADEFARHGMHAPLNWYRTRAVNFPDEKELAERKAAAGEGGAKIATPALFISATHDDALPESMSVGMEAVFENLTRRSVKASHWALWHAADDVNRHILEFVDPVVKPKASI